MAGKITNSVRINNDEWYIVLQLELPQLPQAVLQACSEKVTVSAEDVVNEAEKCLISNNGHARLDIFKYAA